MDRWISWEDKLNSVHRMKIFLCFFLFTFFSFFLVKKISRSRKVCVKREIVLKLFQRNFRDASVQFSRKELKGYGKRKFFYIKFF